MPDGRATINDGSSDVARAIGELAERLPAPLAPLARLAYNYRWSWLPGAPELFASIDPERFKLCLQNPVRLLQEASTEALRRAAADAALVERATVLEAAVEADLDRPTDPAFAIDGPVAFLCAEYGVHLSLPVYSGGLGALAGDLLKEASDRGLPMVAVGLMYRKGYFRQRIDAGGWQHEYWIDTDPQRLPAALVTDEAGKPADGHGADLRRQRSRPDLARRRRARAAVPARHRASGERPAGALDHHAPVRRRRAHAAFSVHPVGRGRRPRAARPGHRAGRGPPQRRPRGAGTTRARRRGAAHGRVAPGCAPGRKVPDGVHHAHAGAGRQRHVSRRRGGAARSAVSPSSCRLPGRGRDCARPDEPRGHRPAVRRHAGGAAAQPRRQRRQPSSWRGRTRDVARAVARPVARRGADRLRHQRRPFPDLGRRPDAGAAGSPSRPRLARPRRRP